MKGPRNVTTVNLSSFVHLPKKVLRSSKPDNYPRTNIFLPSLIQNIRNDGEYESVEWSGNAVW